MVLDKGRDRFYGPYRRSERVSGDRQQTSTTERETLGLIGYVSRIRNNYVRMPLVWLMMPFEIVSFGVRLLISAPERFLRSEPWLLTFDVLTAAANGAFVKKRVFKNSAISNTNPLGWVPSDDG